MRTARPHAVTSSSVWYIYLVAPVRVQDAQRVLRQADRLDVESRDPGRGVQGHHGHVEVGEVLFILWVPERKEGYKFTMFYACN